MTTPYGVQLSGFVIKPLAQIRTDINNRQLAAPKIGAAQDVTDESPLGQMNAAVAAEISECWEMAADVYASNDPEAAVGVPLTNVCSITGTSPQAASPSVCKACALVLDPGADVAAGSTVAVDGRPDITFTTNTRCHNTGGVQATFFTDCTCTATGPIQVNAGTLTEIVSGTTGWISITNPEDCAIGHDVDTPQELRQRRVGQLAKRGGSTPRALRADILDIPGIESCTVLNNRGNWTDVNGLPPHSYEVLLDDGVVPSVSNDVIAQALFDQEPDGIGEGGTSTGNAVDEFGNVQPRKFTRIARLDVYINYTLTVNHTLFPVDGIDQVNAAIQAAGAAYNSGDTVVALFLKSKALTVSGVIDVPVFQLDYHPTPTNTGNLTTTARQRATFQVANFTGTAP